MNCKYCSKVTDAGYQYYWSIRIQKESVDWVRILKFNAHTTHLYTDISTSMHIQLTRVLHLWGYYKIATKLNIGRDVIHS